MRTLSGNEPAPGLELRRTLVRPGATRARADYVLYWMQANRRARQNLALDEAIREANRLELPLVVYEGLRPDYPGASARIHTFVLEGMAANRRDAEARGLRYAAYVPRKDAVDTRTIARLAARAALVVTDESPGYIYSDQTRGLARQIDCPLVTVDACGVVPLREYTKREYSAATMRPKTHRFLEIYLRPQPEERVRTPAGRLDLDLDETDVTRPPADLARETGVDPSVQASPVYRGGRDEALARLADFVGTNLPGYADGRSNAGVEHTSRLSPYIHFGFVGPLEVALAVRDSGAPEPDVAGFLEELLVRRELSYNFVFYEPDHARVDSLPEWARKTLAKHAGDERAGVSEEAMERGTTYDDVWNLTQRELIASGEIHNAARMLWGKKILEWATTPQRAVDLMLEWHFRYALDGRNPATFTNILWCLGLHDRAWGPERPVFGTVRYMSSDSFRRKHDVKAYARRVESHERAAREATP